MTTPDVIRVMTTSGGPNHEGEKWVHYADYQAQAARIAELEVALSTARADALREAARALDTTSDSIWGRIMREAKRNVLALINKEPTS